jgi:hypothetical protein
MKYILAFCAFALAPTLLSGCSDELTRDKALALISSKQIPQQTQAITAFSLAQIVKQIHTSEETENALSEYIFSNKDAALVSFWVGTYDDKERQNVALQSLRESYKKGIIKYVIWSELTSPSGGDCIFVDGCHYVIGFFTPLKEIAPFCQHGDAASPFISHNVDCSIPISTGQIDKITGITYREGFAIAEYTIRYIPTEIGAKLGARD